MTIQQLIQKVKTASNDTWVYLVNNDSLIGEYYEFILDGKFHYAVGKTFIDPLPPYSFKAKTVVDAILGKYKH
jgi:hypothetical protein